MSQPYPSSFSHDQSDGEPRTGASPDTLTRFMPGLALGVLGALDIGLAVQLARAVGTVVAERHAPLIPVLAAAGCAMTAGAALTLTWLLLEDLAGSERSIFS